MLNPIRVNCRAGRGSGRLLAAHTATGQRRYQVRGPLDGDIALRGLRDRRVTPPLFRGESGRLLLTGNALHSASSWSAAIF